MKIDRLLELDDLLDIEIITRWIYNPATEEQEQTEVAILAFESREVAMRNSRALTAEGFRMGYESTTKVNAIIA